MKRRTILGALVLGVGGVGGGYLAMNDDIDLDEAVSNLGTDPEDVRTEAESIEYEELYRNIDEYEGEPVTYDEYTLIDIYDEDDGEFEFILSDDPGLFGDANVLFGLWDGNPFQENDDVVIWGIVNGVRTYQSMAGDNTVPEIEIVDMELRD